MSLVSAILGASGATRAGNAIANANIAAEHGVLNNAQAAQSLSSDAFNQGSQNANAALGSATGMVNDATTKANDILGNTAATQTGNAQPFMAAGQTGIGSISDLLKSYGGNQPQFSFSYDDYKNDPAYQFQLQQGAAALDNSASAKGLLSSGNQLRDLTQFGQGLAATHYDDAFKRALQAFQTNQQTRQNAAQNILAGGSQLLGSGLTGLNSTNAALQNAGNQQAGNTLGAGYFGGQNAIDLSKFLATLGQQAAQYQGTTGLEGSKLAGDFANAAAHGTAEGILGTNNAWSNYANQVQAALMMGLGA